MGEGDGDRRPRPRICDANAAVPIITGLNIP